MDNDTYLHISTVIKKLDDLSVAIGGSEVPTTTTKTNSDFVIGINKSIDAASGKTGVEYPPYSHNTLVTNKLDELAEAISEGGGGGPAPVMGALTATENGNYIPSDYDYDGFNSVNVNVPEPPTPVTDVLSVTENGIYLPSDYSCDAFSQVNVNVAPAPAPAVTPEFVVEYEDIADDGSEKTWTVIHPGLYFLEVTGCYANAELSVSSSNSPYFDHTMNSGPKNRYMCIDLDVGDTVTYSRESYRGLFHAIRFTNCSFDSIIEESIVGDNWTEYDAPSADGAYFMYGSCCGRSGYTQKDESVASGDCNVYSVATSNDCAMAHIIACTSQSSTATIKMYGYDNGGSSVVCLKMRIPKVRDDIELIFQENVHDNETPSFTYTAYEDCKVLAINFDTKFVGTNGHYTNAAISSDGTVLDHDTISHSFGDGKKRDIECAFYLIDVHAGDTITFTNASQYGDTYGCHLIFKMDDISALTVKFDSSHYDNAETNTKIITGNINRTFGIAFELSNQSNYNLETSSFINSGKHLSSRKGTYYSYSAVIGTGDMELTCDNTNAYTTKAYFAVEI